MKNVRKFLSLSICFVVLTALVSCSKDDQNNNNGPYNVEFKVTTSANASISSVTYTSASGEEIIKGSLTGNNWSAKVTVQSGVTVIALSAAAAAADASGTMNVQILVDGKVVQESNASGKTLVASTTYLTASSK